MTGFPFRFSLCFASSLSWLELFIKFAFFPLQKYSNLISLRFCVPENICYSVLFYLFLLYLKDNFIMYEILISIFIFFQNFVIYCTITLQNLKFPWLSLGTDWNFYWNKKSCVCMSVSWMMKFNSLIMYHWQFSEISPTIFIILHFSLISLNAKSVPFRGLHLKVVSLFSDNLKLLIKSSLLWYNFILISIGFYQTS